MRTLLVPTKDGGSLEVSAVVADGFAIHRAAGGGKKWSLTHVASGALVYSNFDRRECVAMRRLVKDWPEWADPLLVPEPGMSQADFRARIAPVHARMEPKYRGAIRALALSCMDRR